MNNYHIYYKYIYYYCNIIKKYSSISLFNKIIFNYNILYTCFIYAFIHMAMTFSCKRQNWFTKNIMYLIIVSNLSSL